MTSHNSSEPYIIEFREVGNLTKVTAIDPRTGIEVSMPVVSNLPRADMMRLAVRKLEYVLEKNSP